MYFTGAEYDSLKTDILYSQRAAFASGTFKNLITQWRCFISFCLYFDLTFLPASLETICTFAQFLSRSFKSSVSIRNYVHGVKLLHVLNGLQFNHLESIEFKLLIRGIARLHPHGSKQAAAITPRILLDIYQHVDFDDDLYLAAWAAFLLTFFLMARKSNMVPSSLRAFDMKKHLSRSNIVFCDFGLLISISWSKTNQFGRRILKIPVLSIPGSPLCPVTAYRNLVSRIPTSATSPAFTFQTVPRTFCLTSHRFVKVLRILLKKAGYDPLPFTGHSFRRGGASYAFKSGVPGELMQLMGDWKSDAYLRYLDYSLSAKLRVGMCMRDLIVQDTL